MLENALNGSKIKLDKALLMCLAQSYFVFFDLCPTPTLKSVGR